MEFRVSSGNPESRLSIPLGLGIIKGGLGTWDAPELRTLSQDRKKISCVGQGIHVVL